MADAYLDVHHIAEETFGKLPDPKEQVARQFFEMPTHRDAARILEHELLDIIYEPETSEYWKCTKSGCYERVEDMLSLACETVDKAVQGIFNSLTAEMGAKIDANVYSKAGAARKKARTKDFMLSALAFFAEAVQVPKLASLWNVMPECLPTQAGILDFSGDTLTIRAPKENEYFRDPLPINAEDVLKADIAPHFRTILLDYFPDPDVCRTALECLSLAVANKGNRIFQVWHGEAGANGKNTLLDILRTILPNRVDTLTAAAITRNGNDGAKRFAAAQLDGLTFAAIDEVAGAFDISEIKRLTGDSTIAVERKKLDAYSIKQRWALAALANKMPSFSPATDIAFLQRLIIIPFDTVFYFDDKQKERYLQLGIAEARLKTACNKDELLARIEGERAAALRYLIDTYLSVRKAGGRPYECERSLKLKQDYQTANDVIEQFFLEHFKRDPFGRVEYARIMSLWQDFTNDKKSSTREIINRLCMRFPWLERKRLHTNYYLIGLSETDSSEPRDPQPRKEDNSENQESLETNTRVLEVPENSFSRLTMGKQENPYVNLKSTSSSTLSTPKAPESKKAEAENEVYEEAGTPESMLYSLLLELYEGHRANLRKNNLPIENAHVYLDELREYAAKNGITDEVFQNTYRALLDSGRIIYEEPYITIEAAAIEGDIYEEFE